MTRTFARAAAAPLAALLLSGCLGGLLGGGKPAQMYRFGAAAEPAGGEGPAAATDRAVQLAPVAFASEVDTDRLLASRGAETFYLKGARWVAPASDLFAAALHEAFRIRAPAVALTDRRDGAPGAAVLRIAVTRFEARYDSPAKDASPIARIEGVAVLADPKGGTPDARYRIAASAPAVSGRIDDVVAAFDAADAQAVNGIADWAAARR